MRFAVVLAAAALMLPLAAQAQVNTITASPKAKAEQKSMRSDGTLCKSRTVLGSRLPTRKVCRTPEQWAAEEKHAKEELEKIQHNGAMRNCIIGPNGVCIQS
ncbi:hypothetical protein [Caulobacter sp. NIBR1757]|uniref:hypothetical protein n=1 Tax=Caulobacter sp. NIBR1757 TaxID=3016000 RepID=UPI0022F0BE0A|nr:hypothetical protein [Caulobacter sp. NIBR1757]WGM40592.1 hypothetical protein AMEJIAPC_03537 [Caulobacter sp. NIBR1757]